MLKPAAMRRVSVLILDDDLEELTRHIQEEGIVQLSSHPTEPPLGRHRVQELDSRGSVLSSRVDRMTSLLEEARKSRAEKRGLLDRLKQGVAPPEPKRRIMDPERSEEIIDWCAAEIDSVAPEVDRLGEELKSLTDRTGQLQEHLSLVRDMMPIKVPLVEFRSAEITSSFFFYLPADRVPAFMSTCREQIKPVHTSVVSGVAKQLILAMSLVEDRGKLLEQIHRFEGEIIDLPPYDEVPRQAEAVILDDLARLKKETERTTDEIYDLAVKHLEDLQVVAEVLVVERQKIDALKLFARTESTVLLTGWVPEKDLDRLERVVSSATSDRYFIRSSAADDEGPSAVPISLENPRVFNSFEWVTKMYGLPNYKEVDPTTLIVPTFAVFFGTCLTDAGYGIILALVSFFLLRKMWGEKVGLAFTLCGLMTILMGWLTGGWFGNIFYAGDYGPNIALFKAAWVDPLSREGTMPFLALALLMGILHLEIGHITAILASARRGHLAKGLVTHVGWMMTLGFGSIFILWRLELSTASSMWQSLSTWGMTLGILLGIVGYVWERSGSARAAGPAQFVYDILGHIADVISYSRLLALGISTAVNAFLIDLLLVGLAWPSLPPGAGALRIVISVMLAIVLSIGFVMLHLVNMGLNCLSAFVHTMRLHFAEYFSKFYEAGGDEFIPFRAERTLTMVRGFEGGGT